MAQQEFIAAHIRSSSIGTDIERLAYRFLFPLLSYSLRSLALLPLALGMKRERVKIFILGLVYAKGLTAFLRRGVNAL